MTTDTELLKAKAAEGDMSAVLALSTHYYNQENYTEALHWAEQAAQAGNPNGMVHAILLHSIFLMNAQDQREWAILADESATVRRYCTELLRIHEEATDFRLFDNIASDIRDALANARYHGAMATFYLDNADEREGLRLLEGMDSPRENFMRALLRLSLDEPDWSVEEVVACVADEAYAATSKTHAEEGIFCMAVVIASQYHQKAGDLNQAVTLLKKRLAHVVHQDMADVIRQELALYRRRLFGGWKYTGS